MKDEVKERVDKAVQKKKAEQKCLYCGQKVDDEIMKEQFVETKLPIPRAQWALLTQEQSKINSTHAEAQRVRFELSNQVIKIAKSHGINYLSGLGVETLPGEHEWELFYTDPMNRKPVYMGKHLTEDEQKDVGNLHWKLATCNQNTQEAEMERQNVLWDVARDLQWGFTPIIEDKGYLIAPDLIKQAFKRGQESEKAKAEREKKKR